jgi:plastocyanin
MISVNGIVKFVMPSLHNVAPNPMRNTDSGLRVDFGATVCLEFDKAGSFGFLCSSHGFTGTIVVQ